MAILGLSGGCDTTTLAYHLKKDINEEHIFVHFIYPQKAKDIELFLSRRTAKKLNVPLLEIPFNLYDKIAQSYMFEKDKEFVKGRQFWLEGRNTLIGVILGIIASKYKQKRIYFGCHKPISGNWKDETYPDASPEFFESLEQTINLGFYNQVKIINPFSFMDYGKKEIKKWGDELGVPWEDTITCCSPVNNKHCWKCESCKDRLFMFDGKKVDNKNI